MTRGYVRVSMLALLLDEGVASRPKLSRLIGCSANSAWSAMESLVADGLAQLAPADPSVKSTLPVYGLTPKGIEAAMCVDPSDVEHA